MKKNTRTVEAYRNSLTKKQAVLRNMRARLSGNTLSDDAISEAQALIEEKEAEIQALNDAIDELGAADEDKDEELKARIEELQAKVQEVQESLKAPRAKVALGNFLNSKDAMRQFASAVKNSKNSSEFRSNWREVLTKNGITTDGEANTGILPEAILTEINDLWENSADNFLSLLDITGLKAIKALYDSNDVDAETARAKGHKKGDEKAEQELVFLPKEIRAQIVYKYIRIDRETVEYEGGDGMLMQYVARELTYRIYHEIMRAVLVGDGRDASSEYKISKIEAIIDADSIYTTAITAEGTTPTMTDFMNLVNAIEADGAIVLVTSKEYLTAIRARKFAEGGTTEYVPVNDVAGMLGVDTIITTKLLPTTSNVAAIAFVGKAYKVVGDVTMHGFEDFNLSYNKNEYLYELYIGGGLTTPYSAAYLTVGE